MCARVSALCVKFALECLIPLALPHHMELHCVCGPYRLSGYICGVLDGQKEEVKGLVRSCWAAGKIREAKWMVLGTGRPPIM